MKLGIVQSKPRKGDIASNLADLGEVFAQLAAEETPYELIVLPEAALTGYFLEGAVYELAFEREKMILAGRSAPEIDRRLMALQIGNSTTVQVIGGVLSSLFFGPIIGLPTAAVLRSRARRAPTAPRMIRPAA